MKCVPSVFAKLFISICFIYSYAARSQESIDISLVNGLFAASNTRVMVVGELSKPAQNGQKPNVQVTEFPLNQIGGPLNMSFEDFNTADYLPWGYDPADSSKHGPVPQTPVEGLKWFRDQVESGNAPDVLVIGGHQVISMGWHNHAETRFMFLPTLLHAVQNDPSARAYFDNIKLAILGGCNPLTNLEPHMMAEGWDESLRGASASLVGKKQGDFLTPDEIRAIYFFSPAGKNFVIGKTTKGTRWNSLEFYRDRLAREYGPGMEHYVYTRGAKNEKCEDTGHGYKACHIGDVDRLFPDYGLFDGSHRFNYPIMMRMLFRKANLVTGYASASPNDDRRALILQSALNSVRAELTQKGYPIQNVLYSVFDPNLTPADRDLVISRIRYHWTAKTYEMNRQRPSGSITPALPQMDQDGIFTNPVSSTAPTYQPYRDIQIDASGTGPVLLNLE